MILKTKLYLQVSQLDVLVVKVSALVQLGESRHGTVHSVNAISTSAACSLLKNNNNYQKC